MGAFATHSDRQHLRSTPPSTGSCIKAEGVVIAPMLGFVEHGTVQQFADFVDEFSRDCSPRSTHRGSQLQQCSIATALELVFPTVKTRTPSTLFCTAVRVPVKSTLTQSNAIAPLLRGAGSLDQLRSTSACLRQSYSLACQQSKSRHRACLASGTCGIFPPESAGRQTRVGVGH